MPGLRHRLLSAGRRAVARLPPPRDAAAVWLARSTVALVRGTPIPGGSVASLEALERRQQVDRARRSLDDGRPDAALVAIGPVLAAAPGDRGALQVRRRALVEQGPSLALLAAVRAELAERESAELRELERATEGCLALLDPRWEPPLERARAAAPKRPSGSGGEGAASLELLVVAADREVLGESGVVPDRIRALVGTRDPAGIVLVPTDPGATTPMDGRIDDTRWWVTPGLGALDGADRVVTDLAWRVDRAALAVGAARVVARTCPSRVEIAVAAAAAARRAQLPFVVEEVPDPPATAAAGPGDGTGRVSGSTGRVSDSTSRRAGGAAPAARLASQPAWRARVMADLVRRADGRPT